jgi:hypothetical protein
MKVRLHPHAEVRIEERGATRDEIIAAVEHGERFPAKHGRTGFRRNYAYNGLWRGRPYAVKQVEAYAVEESDGWLVITVIVKFF